jgi:ParB/RepB/Spo0J family partition protein
MSTVLTLPNENVTEMPVEAQSAFTLLAATSWGLADASVTQMPIGSILVSPNGDAQATDLDGLVASIRARGILHPLVVAPGGRLLAGRRRLEAARRAGLATIPVRVCEIDTERAAIEIGLIENVERTDLDPLTRAKSYRGLIQQGATVEEIANLVGQETGHVYQHLQLLDLHPEVQHALHVRMLSYEDARALVPLEHTDQAAVLQEIHSSPKPLSARQVKLRVDARRVMRLVRQNNPGTRMSGGTLASDSQNLESDAEGTNGSYAALFETEDVTTSVAQSSAEVDPLNQLNALIAEMVASAQGEDQVRAWARRLSHILETLLAHASALDAESKKKSASAVQDRLL